MITVVCTTCRMCIRTVGSEEEIDQLAGAASDWFPDKYPCARAGCEARAQYVEAIEPTALAALEVHDLTPLEAFAAFCHLGLPEERDCGETAVREVFSEQEVEAIGAHQIRGANRTILEWVRFKDGTRLYLASSTEGATVYRIATPHSYTGANGG